MKKIAFLFVVVASMIGAASCKKCSTCSYQYTMAGDDSTVTYPETCGDNLEIKEYEDKVKADAATNNGIVTCSSAAQ